MPIVRATCANPVCSCPVDDEGRSCGAYCANVADGEQDTGSCSCEHVACAEDRTVPRSGPEAATSTGPGPGRPPR